MFVDPNTGNPHTDPHARNSRFQRLNGLRRNGGPQTPAPERRRSGADTETGGVQRQRSQTQPMKMAILLAHCRSRFGPEKPRSMLGASAGAEGSTLSAHLICHRLPARERSPRSDADRKMVSHSERKRERAMRQGVSFVQTSHSDHQKLSRGNQLDNPVLSWVWTGSSVRVIHKYSSSEPLAS